MLKLTELRIKSEYRQSDIAKMTGKSRSTIASYETGRTKPTYSVIILLKKIFNYYGDDLLDEVDFKKKIIRK